MKNYFTLEDFEKLKNEKFTILILPRETGKKEWLKRIMEGKNNEQNKILRFESVVEKVS